MKAFTPRERNQMQATEALVRMQQAVRSSQEESDKDFWLEVAKTWAIIYTTLYVDGLELLKEGS